jgi:SnoaL-like domain
MPQENVEIVRSWFAPLRGDSEPEQMLAAVSEFWDATGDYYPVSKFPEARPCHGREEVAQFVVQFGEAFARFDWAIRWVIAVGDDRVLACANLRAEGRGSGINLEGDVYHCFWLRHGHFFRSEDHLTLRGALRALGFEGETLEAAGLKE